MTNLYAIGDVHGCLAELNDVLSQIMNDTGDEPATIVFLGDYVDRGPNSAGAVSKLIELKESESTSPHRYVFLFGNHEHMMFDWMKGNIYGWDNSYGKNTVLSYRSERIDMTDHCRWLEDNCVYFHRETVDGRPFVFVHAGLDPFRTPEDVPDEDLVWSRDFQYYDGMFVDNAYVVHGHTPTEKVLELSNQMDIDTGCVFGGKLTAVRIDGTGKFKFFHS